jgi:hypothetical protein
MNTKVARLWVAVVCGLILSLFDPAALFGQTKLASSSEYHKYVDPLLKIEDFGISYSEDGAADATVLFPNSGTGRPVEPVIALVRLRQKGFSLLIDCLSDSRLTSASFGGNTIMKVPVGYICLDLLMGTTRGKPVSDPDCADDGLGACMEKGFYFRPDDYYHCVDRLNKCLARPWIPVVQQNWRREFLRNRLQFINPYENIQEYKEFTSPK